MADAITFPWGSISLFGIDKVVNFHMDVPLYVTPFGWALNPGNDDRLSAALKLLKHATSTTAGAVKGGAPAAGWPGACVRRGAKWGGAAAGAARAGP